ncbi:MAG: T9SS type A sorting domain-containing protein, partial [Desulfobacterales bacterium]|nr:T9SS type A sorting domain-containing protein [Desulfobacterales bacterium]
NGADFVMHKTNGAVTIYFSKDGTLPECTLKSAESLANAGLEIIPNPFTDYFTLTGIENIQQVEIYTISGKLVLSLGTNEALDRTIQIDNAITAGSYVVKVTTDSNVYTKKLLKH